MEEIDVRWPVPKPKKRERPASLIAPPSSAFDKKKLSVMVGAARSVVRGFASKLTTSTSERFQRLTNESVKVEGCFNARKMHLDCGSLLNQAGKHASPESDGCEDTRLLRLLAACRLVTHHVCL